MNFPRSSIFFSKLDRYFYPAVFVISFLYVLTLIADYDLNWTHPEVVRIQIPGAVKNGVAIVPADLLRGFDVSSYDWGGGRYGRSRFVSYFFSTFNVKIRLLLLRFFPPHPSLSIIWIFTLILSPILFFKLIHQLTGDRKAAWVGASLFLLSTGTLSGITMLFHPAKPLALFFILAGCNLGFRLGQLARREEYFSRRYNLLLAGLLGVSLAACFTDETAWYIFICVPILSPGILRDKRRGWFTIGLYFSMFIVFLYFVTCLAPIITRKLFEQNDFDFWKFALSDNKTVFGNHIVANTFKNARNLIGSQLVPDLKYSCRGLSAGTLYFGALLFYLISAFLGLNSDRKRIVLRGSVALLLFFVFQSLILLPRGEEAIIDTSFYYGNLTAVFLSLPLAILLAADKKSFKALNKLVLIIILATYAYNFTAVNYRWMRQHHDVHRHSYWFRGESEGVRAERLSYPMVKHAWENRSDRAALEEMKARYPLKSLWLFLELECISSAGND